MIKTACQLNRFLFDVNEIDDEEDVLEQKRRPSSRQQKENNESDSTDENLIHYHIDEVSPQQQHQYPHHHNDVEHNDDTPIVTLPINDYRTIHAAKILSVRNGDTIRAGLVSCDEHDGLITDRAVVQWLPEGKVKKSEPLKKGDPPGSLRIRLQHLQQPTNTVGESSMSESSLPLNQQPVSLILALPRPIQLGRMLPMISQMGVDHLVLTEARKVPKDYFGSHLFRRPEALRERLIEGLCQAGDVKLPTVHVVRRLSKFLVNDMDKLFPKDMYARVIAHPMRTSTSLQPIRKGDNNEDDDNDDQGTVVANGAKEDCITTVTDDEQRETTNEPSLEYLRMRHVHFPSSSSLDSNSSSRQPRRMVIAIGPEGGWEEPEEIELFLRHGFQAVTMGTRVLRSDCAVVSLLGLAHDVCHEGDS